MEGQLVKAIAKNIPGSPQKTRLIADLVRGKAANEALVALKFMPNAAAKTVAKVIKTAVANAEENFGMNSEDLVIDSILVDEASNKWRKRRRYASRGRAVLQRRRASHISVVLVESVK
jgi:large subunit ribosomal protein L22